MPKTGETIYFYLDDGNWFLTNNPNHWRERGHFVMECYVITAS